MIKHAEMRKQVKILRFFLLSHPDCRWQFLLRVEEREELEARRGFGPPSDHHGQPRGHPCTRRGDLTSPNIERLLLSMLNAHPNGRFPRELRRVYCVLPV